MVMLENAVLEFCALGWKKGSRISTLLAGLNGNCTERFRYFVEYSSYYAWNIMLVKYSWF